MVTKTSNNEPINTDDWLSLDPKPAAQKPNPIRSFSLEGRVDLPSGEEEGVEFNSQGKISESGSKDGKPAQSDEPINTDDWLVRDPKPAPQKPNPPPSYLSLERRGGLPEEEDMEFKSQGKIPGSGSKDGKSARKWMPNVMNWLDRAKSAPHKERPQKGEKRAGPLEGSSKHSRKPDSHTSGLSRFFRKKMQIQARPSIDEEGEGIGSQDKRSSSSSSVALAVIHPPRPDQCLGSISMQEELNRNTSDDFFASPDDKPSLLIEASSFQKQPNSAVLGGQSKAHSSSSRSIQQHEPAELFDEQEGSGSFSSPFEQPAKDFSKGAKGLLRLEKGKGEKYPTSSVSVREVREDERKLPFADEEPVSETGEMPSPASRESINQSGPQGEYVLDDASDPLVQRLWDLVADSTALTALANLCVDPKTLLTAEVLKKLQKTGWIDSEIQIIGQEKVTKLLRAYFMRELLDFLGPLCPPENRKLSRQKKWVFGGDAVIALHMLLNGSLLPKYDWEGDDGMRNYKRWFSNNQLLAKRKAIFEKLKDTSLFYDNNRVVGSRMVHAILSEKFEINIKRKRLKAESVAEEENPD